jgi:hypothetical protein
LIDEAPTCKTPKAKTITLTSIDEAPTCKMPKAKTDYNNID